MTCMMNEWFGMISCRIVYDAVVDTSLPALTSARLTGSTVLQALQSLWVMFEPAGHRASHIDDPSA